jgi:hypothetical protein
MSIRTHTQRKEKPSTSILKEDIIVDIPGVACAVGDWLTREPRGDGFCEHTLKYPVCYVDHVYPWWEQHRSKNVNWWQWKKLLTMLLRIFFRLKAK